MNEARIFDNDENVPFKHDDDSESEEEVVHHQSAEKKRKCIVVSQPSGLDRIYIDNQKLWKEIAKLKSENERLEERLRYANLEGNNRYQKLLLYKSDKEKWITTTRCHKNSIFWLKVHRNSLTFLWFAFVMREYVFFLSYFIS